MKTDERACSLQLRQSQDRLLVPPGNLKAEDERRPLTYPAKEIPQRNGDAPPPLPGTPGGIIQVIESPR